MRCPESLLYKNIPANVTSKTIRLRWYCRRRCRLDGVETIIKYAAVEAYKNAASRGNIRAVMHHETYAGPARPDEDERPVIPDPQEVHFTDEFQENKTRDWVN